MTTQQTLAPEDVLPVRIPDGHVILHGLDARHLLELADLIDEVGDGEAAARERLRYLLAGLGRHCLECDVPANSLHRPGCVVARCQVTGENRIRCAQAGHTDCGEDIWLGFFRGQDDARALGLFSRPGYDGEPPSVLCDATHPAARPDLLILREMTEWDPATQHWIRRAQPGA